MARGPPFALLPSELTLNIFCQLSSFTDVFALAGTCRGLRQIYSAYTTLIYSRVAPRSIACESYARRFLIDQDGGPAIGSPFSVADMLRVAKNSSVVEKAIRQFEKEIVSRVRMDGYSAREYYGAGTSKHPPTLTPTERPRFIRSYYLLWGMMKMDLSGWRSRLQSMTLKQLYYLHEMTKLTQSIGQGEEKVPPPFFPDEPRDSIHSINSGQSDKRIALGEKVWQQIQDVSQRIFNQDAPDPSAYTKEEGFLWFVVMWDHWHLSLKDMVYHQSRSTIRPSPDIEKRYLWDDNEDEGE